MTARPNEASAVHGLKCADLVDAMGRLHRYRCHILDLVTPTPGRVLFGSAVTISRVARLRSIPSATTSRIAVRREHDHLAGRLVADRFVERLPETGSIGRLPSESPHANSRLCEVVARKLVEVAQAAVREHPGAPVLLQPQQLCAPAHRGIGLRASSPPGRGRGARPVRVRRLLRRCVDSGRPDRPRSGSRARSPPLVALAFVRPAVLLSRGCDTRDSQRMPPRIRECRIPMQPRAWQGKRSRTRPEDAAR
jgi:hypothetical protein